MTGLRRRISWLGVVTFFMCGGVASSAGDASLDMCPPEAVSSLTIARNVVKTDDEPWTVECKNRDLIEKLLTIVQEASLSKDHKCPDIGTVTIHCRGEKTLTLGILPGHDENLYQFRHRTKETYAIYQVERTAFLDALKAMGCPVDDPAFPR